MNTDEQLTLWVDGKSFCPNDDGECCPDFSCCRPELLAPEDERTLFAKANDEIRHGMLMGFLGRALAGFGKKVHIAGSTEGED